MSEINPSPEFEEMIRKAMQTPNANQEFVNRLHGELTRRSVRNKSRFVLKAAWVIALLVVATVLVLSAPRAATALKQLFGYVPDVGLVENTGNLRMLAEPVSVKRDDVTLTITSVFVYADRVELIYEVDGVKETYSNQKDMCGADKPDDSFWSDADADLRLPDGTVIRRDYAGTYQSENRYAMKPVYAVHVPAEANEMTLLLKCVPFTRLGEAPEDWEVPFKLVAVPAETVVGAPVIDIEPSPVAPASVQPTIQPTAEAPKIPAPVVIMSLERIVPMDSRTIFYFSMDMENRDPSLVSIMPGSVYLIDSLGQKTQLIGNFALQPFEHRPGTAFEFMSQSKPAEGPLTIVVENAIAYYAPLYVDPAQATPDEMSFTFEAGTDPQHNQEWDINKPFKIGGYDFVVTSARAVTWDDVKVPEFIDGSQGYEYGYQFGVQGDAAVKMDVEIDIMSDPCGFTVKTNYIPSSSSVLITQLCRDAFPSGDVKVTIWELSILLEQAWQATWTPPEQ